MNDVERQMKMNSTDSNCNYVHIGLTLALVSLSVITPRTCTHGAWALRLLSSGRSFPAPV